MQHAIVTGELFTQTLLDTLAVFNESFQAYTVDKIALEPLKDLTQETEIITIVGTWCPDCFREVPRFIKVLAHLDNPKIKARYIGVDRNKLDEAGIAAQFDFSRIPTIIVRQKGQEIGRIVESPNLSLEQDLLKILAKG
jgi:thiol-disulfide isomerase/thioredoxin